MTTSTITIARAGRFASLICGMAAIIIVGWNPHGVATPVE